MFDFDLEKARYERKFVVFDEDTRSLIQRIKLHPSNFKEIFHERKVHNIYFDSIQMDHYKANVIGSEKRLKVRLRWYGESQDNYSNAQIEIKIKKGLLGHKLAFSIDDFRPKEFQNQALIQRLIRNTHIPNNERRLMDHLRPVLINQYSRRYFLSFDRKFRITVDENLRYREYANRQDALNKYVDEPGKKVLELKYLAVQNELAKEVSQVFPFRMTKNSKYVSGVDRLGLLRSEEKVFA